MRTTAGATIGITAGASIRPAFTAHALLLFKYPHSLRRCLPPDPPIASSVPQAAAENWDERLRKPVIGASRWAGRLR